MSKNSLVTIVISCIFLLIIFIYSAYKISTMNTQLMPTITTITVEGATGTISTNYGDIKVELYPELTPETYKNFKTLADDGKYNDTIFHRVIADFMIQTGDFERANGTGGYSYKGPGTKFEDEIVADLKHEYGTLSMANSGPNTNGSQFFIVQAKGGTPWLDGKHTVFGKVIEGIEVVEAITALEVDHMDRPITD
jgi:cyclophilin family peptidyl-prolyl cis-trans isomerase